MRRFAPIATLIATMLCACAQKNFGSVDRSSDIAPSKAVLIATIIPEGPANNSKPLVGDFAHPIVMHFIRTDASSSAEASIFDLSTGDFNRVGTPKDFTLWVAPGTYRLASLSSIRAEGYPVRITTYTKAFSGRTLAITLPAGKTVNIGEFHVVPVTNPNDGITLWQQGEARAAALADGLPDQWRSVIHQQPAQVNLNSSSIRWDSSTGNK